MPGDGSWLTETLATEALTMALRRRPPTAELLHHSDRGAPYAATLYREQLASHWDHGEHESPHELLG